MDKKSTIQSFIVKNLLSGKFVEFDDNLLLSGLIDSLGVMHLVRYLEETFNIKIPPEDVTISNLMTITAIASYVERR